MVTYVYYLEDQRDFVSRLRVRIVEFIKWLIGVIRVLTKSSVIQGVWYQQCLSESVDFGDHSPPTPLY